MFSTKPRRSDVVKYMGKRELNITQREKSMILFGLGMVLRSYDSGGTEDSTLFAKYNYTRQDICDLIEKLIGTADMDLSFEGLMR